LASDGNHGWFQDKRLAHMKALLPDESIVFDNENIKHDFGLDKESF